MTRFPTASCVSHGGATGRSPISRPGERAAVSRVPDADPELLRYLSELGLTPGADVEVVSHAPFAGR